MPDPIHWQEVHARQPMPPADVDGTRVCPTVLRAPDGRGLVVCTGLPVACWGDTAEDAMMAWCRHIQARVIE